LVKASYPTDAKFEDETFVRFIAYLSIKGLTMRTETDATESDKLANHFAGRDISKMNAEQIMELFIWLDFKDDIGHPLTSCIDFHELVERATGEKLTRTCGDNGYSKQQP
jgi:hypothetical protein